MSTEKTVTLVDLENTEDISEEVTERNDATIAVPETETADEQKQTAAVDTRAVTAALDVAETADLPEEDQEDDAAQAVPAATVTIMKDAVTEEAAADAAENGDENAGSGTDEESAQKEEQESETETETDPETEAIKEKIRERKREKKRKAIRRKTAFWTGFIIITLSIACFLFSISGFFTVDSIEVRGNSHFSAEEIINIAHAVPGHNLLYNTDEKPITDYLEQNPYIKSASVSRKLPSTLVITVEERAEAICFNYDDDYLIMDDEGTLLKKTRTEPKITNVKGFVVTRIRLGDTVGTENQQMFSRLLRLIRAMKAADLYFVSIDMTGYEDNMAVKAYIYDKLVVKTDYETLLINLKNGRLHKIVEKLFEDDVKRGTITITENGEASFEPGI